MAIVHLSICDGPLQQVLEDINAAVDACPDLAEVFSGRAHDLKPLENLLRFSLCGGVLTVGPSPDLVAFRDDLMRAAAGRVI